MKIENQSIPLAEQLRPKDITDIFGQDHLLGKGQSLSLMVQNKALRSMILWGPPGCGKTTLARILAESSGYQFEALSAVFSGVAELRQVFDRARDYKKMDKRTVIFVDEIHRFNKSQQDAFLPVVEDGTIILIGATTENPSFALNSALLSRCPVMILKSLDTHALEKIISRSETQLNIVLPLEDDARQLLIQMSDGDGRYLLSMIDSIISFSAEEVINQETLQNILQKRAVLYDKNQEEHYNLISALHKAVRGSDADAALYWLARMLQGGENPDFIARRMVRMAAEDIGLADPQALSMTMDAWQGLERLGQPEGELLLAQAVVYLAMAPKSNAVYTAFKKAQKRAQDTGSWPPPRHAVNAPTRLMRENGYGAGYVYDHDTEMGFAGLDYFPDGLKRDDFYQPVSRGFEREMQKRLTYFVAHRKGTT